MFLLRSVWSSFPSHWRKAAGGNFFLPQQSGEPVSRMLKQSTSEDGLTFYLSGGGFSYGEISKAGKVDLRSIAKHFEGGRTISLEKDGYTSLDIRSASANRFIRSQIVELSRTFHTTASVTSPWIMKTWISYLGKTSFCMDSETRCQKTGVFLGRCLVHVVRVDMETRRPAPLPKEGCEKYRKSVTMDSPPRFDFPSTEASQEQIYKCSITTLPSDTDSNNHVNQAIYFRYCADCVSLAAAKGGVLSKFHRDVVYYDLKTVKVEYVGEIEAGSVVDILCWEDTCNAAVLYFLLKVGERVACRCVGEWYTDPDGILVVTKKNTVLPSNLYDE